MTRAAALCLLLALAGCIGRAGPVEEYLRVGAGGDACAGAASAAGPRSLVGLKTFKATDALDRQAVMLATGRVMAPSLRWYWEAAPARLFEHALHGALACSGRLAPVWPVRSGTEAAMTVAGQVTDFAVETKSMTLRASLDLQAFGPDGSTQLGAKRFAVSAKIAALDAASIAEGGHGALEGLSAEAAAWLETLVSARAAKAGKR
jgi:ABC-type uncharacterized transport system auxiliary subunit